MIQLEITDRVATVTLTRPPMNAISAALSEQVRDTAVALADRDDVRAVVLTGSERVFAAGADIKEMAELSAAQMRVHGRHLVDAVEAVANLPQPTIAAINGYALGGGCELALAADFRVAAERAKVGFPEILLGVIPGAGGTQRLPRLVGVARAKELIYSGRMIDATDALQIGLIDRVVLDPLTVAQEWAGTLAGGPAQALRTAKHAIDTGIDGPLAAGLALEHELFAGLFDTEDQRVGFTSFLEHGPGKAQFP